MDITQIWEVLKGGGIGLALLGALMLSFRGVWMWTSTHKEIMQLVQTQLDETKKERNTWRELALKGTAMAGIATAFAEKRVDA